MLRSERPQRRNQVAVAGRSGRHREIRVPLGEFVIRLFEEQLMNTREEQDREPLRRRGVQQQPVQRWVTGDCQRQRGIQGSASARRRREVGEMVLQFRIVHELGHGATVPLPTYGWYRPDR